MPVPPRPASDLQAWLGYLERLHPATIELGLERVARVRDRLGLAPAFPLITVGGTNGKGSTCAMLESCLRCAGYRVGCYASPHLLRYNERVRLNGVEASDGALVAAFERVEQARGQVSLTYFEFGTLAAVLLFLEAGLDVAVLEVGLGGRLDAVNAFEPDCAVVVSIGLDHTDYLGPTREHIAFEKAGIFRAGKPAVVAEADPPASLIRRARDIGADLYLIDRDFGFVAGETQWQFWDWRGKRDGLPLPALRGGYQLANASAALAALESIRDAAAGRDGRDPPWAGGGRSAGALSSAARSPSGDPGRGSQSARCRSTSREPAGECSRAPAHWRCSPCSRTRTSRV